MDARSAAQDNGRKRHIAVDTNGLVLAVVVTMASAALIPLAVRA
jgi:hypothetical protein